MGLTASSDCLTHPPDQSARVEPDLKGDLPAARLRSPNQLDELPLALRAVTSRVDMDTPLAQYHGPGQTWKTKERKVKRVLISSGIVVLICLLAGCAATTTLNASQGGTTIAVKKSEQTAAPRTEEFGTTSFGNYEFLAESPGFEPFTGILPLKFNGGYLALDILFFAPAMFFNLREVYPYYEIDMQARVVKYKNKGAEEWHIYVPREAEVARGREYFKIQ
jgi:hypothetical protein